MICPTATENLSTARRFNDGKRRTISPGCGSLRPAQRSTEGHGRVEGLAGSAAVSPRTPAPQNLVIVRLLAAVASLTILATESLGQTSIIPQSDTEPILRLDPGGPTSYVTALAFDPDGNTLMAGGWDKLVRVWHREEETRQFRLDRRAAYRVPIGAGSYGAINAIAVSADGRLLAIAGLGIVRGSAGPRNSGLVLPGGGTLSDEMRRDQGVIYVFDTRTRNVRILRGHNSSILSLAFAPPQDGKPPILVSVASEEPNKEYRELKIWDVAQSTSINDFTVKPIVKGRPGIVIWHTGPRARDIQLALAWGDGFLRLWDGATGRWSHQREQPYNYTVVHPPGTRNLITGSGTQLKRWQISPPGGALSLRTTNQVDLAGNPQAIGLFASAGGRQHDHVVCVVRPPSTTQLSLSVVRLADFQVAGPATRLWDGRDKQPVLAAAPLGDRIAVAGVATHEIKVYAAAELLRAGDRPQTLRSLGTIVREIGFVLDGDRQGLRLEFASDRARDGEVVFDLSEGQVSPDAGPWRDANASPTPWRAEPLPNDSEHGLMIFQGANQVAMIRLGDKRQQITSFALMPPGGATDVPLVAVAVVKDGQPRLALYNALSGEQIRQLTAHTERISSLAFARDGRLLASAADDQTVCVWNLADTNATIGKLGGIRELQLTRRGDDLVVTKAPAGDPAAGRSLSDGDVIEGVATAEGLERFETPVDLYRAFAARKPGETITLRRNLAPRDVQLEVGQGIDERKPLFSLFFGPTEGRDRRPWIGWSPLGRYDASDREFESILGWHFNTGKPDAPTAFALAEEYRETYFTHGLLRELIENDGPAPESSMPPVPRPGFSLLIRTPDGDPQWLDGSQEALIQDQSAALSLSFEPFFPRDLIASVRWQLDDAAPQSFDLASANRWSADLSQVGWKRGQHVLRVSLTTNEIDPQEFIQNAGVRFQPPPPQVEVGLAESPQAVDDPELRFTADVVPSPGGSAVSIRLRHWHQSEELLARNFDVEGSTPLAERLTLLPGDNHIELQAINRGALRGFEEFETRTLRRVVRYNPQADVAVAPLEINLKAIVVSLADGQESARMPIDSNASVVVDTPTVLIEGEIVTEGELEMAEWRYGGHDDVAPWSPLDEPASTIGQTLRLEPGPREFRIRARATGGGVRDAGWTIDYRPQLPRIQLLDPPQDSVRFEGTDKPNFDLRARLHLPAQQHPFEAKVFVNHEEVPARLDLANGSLSAPVRCRPGPNLIEIQLENEWGSSLAIEPLRVSFRRPPRIVDVQRDAIGTSPLINLRMRVRSSRELPPTAIEIAGIRRELQASEIAQASDDAGAWEVTLADVPLERGPNTIPLRVRNDEGWSVEPEVVEITYRPVPPQKATIVFGDQRRSINVDTPRYGVRLMVRSLSPLRQVRLRSESGISNLVVDDQRRTSDGTYELVVEQHLRLRPGINRIVAVAINEGGMHSEDRYVNYTAQPARLVVKSISLSADPRVILVPIARPSRSVVFAEPVAEGRARLHGRVILPNDSLAESIGDEFVRVFVNGFQQPQIQLKKLEQQASQWAFDVAICLNREEANRIEVRLPSIPTAMQSSTEFTVDCERPVVEQTLNMLIVGVGESDKSQLEERVERALHIGRGEVARPLGATLRRGDVTTLVGEQAKKERVLYELDSLSRDLSLASGQSNDVFVFYYRGRETRDNMGNPLLATKASEFQTLKSSAVSSHHLENFLEGIPGAHLVLLDVRADQRIDSPSWPEDSQVGMLRYRWLRDANTPDDARLISSVERAVPRADYLELIEKEIAREYLDVSSRYPESVSYDRHIPPQLRDLPIGLP